jgi:hypothetical protein
MNVTPGYTKNRTVPAARIAPVRATEPALRPGLDSPGWTRWVAAHIAITWCGRQKPISRPGRSSRGTSRSIDGCRGVSACWSIHVASGAASAV